MQKKTLLRPEFCRINEQLQDKEEQKIYPKAMGSNNRNFRLEW